jgi:hypothetical protein
LNTNKPGACEDYKKVSDEEAEKLDKLAERKNETNE